MFRAWWKRFRAQDARREAAIEQMSPAEQRFEHESFENLQSGEFVTEHLGQNDRPIAEDEPPR